MMTTTSSIISLALLSFLSHILILNAEIHKCFIDNGYFSNTAIYRTNLNFLLSNLTSDTDIDYGFYSAFYGEYPNRVYALGHCRGDVNPDSCRTCLNNAAKILPNLCPNQKKAVLYDELCILRYSSRSMLGIYENPDFSFCMANPNNETDADVYNGSLDDLLVSLRSNAVAGDSERKYAAGNMRTGSGTIYGLVQCTPDLSRLDCKDCLSKAVSEIPNCSGNKAGGRIIKLSCFLRYEHYAFFDS
ncbi:cysteine-rich repeat secretory protein 38-like [Prosopis cineraria]|uniref:cysteine-rich repeat secretory protein 38-like n=1 Tax=Prosopis cineraria TaxID=364024 RepID=UPI00241085A2|nr:cysteine-rich repeat secretory protein 38-like [Prosopis cineraria]